MKHHLFHIDHIIYYQMSEKVRHFFFKLKSRLNPCPTCGLTPCKIVSNEPIYNRQWWKGMFSAISLKVPYFIPLYYTVSRPCRGSPSVIIQEIIPSYMISFWFYTKSPTIINWVKNICPNLNDWCIFISKNFIDQRIDHQLNFPCFIFISFFFAWN